MLPPADPRIDIVARERSDGNYGMLKITECTLYRRLDGVAFKLASAKIAELARRVALQDGCLTQIGQACREAV